jgi:ATP-dependent Clp protease ATP-binding subunit ClpC
VPADILDDSIPLNQGELRQWFERRIMGQAEAVDSVIDLVTLIKAGLTDPTKPFGVFLFIGPTGVGKTELAKALAEFIFGNPDRLKRFDMSEFASYEGFTRLIGKDNQPGLLTEAIRQHPFSVVLLDEIEKSHQNVFDLCLQIFDAGRLTDGQGRTVDFRRTIIILTSNIGASVPTVSVGFHSGGTALPPESDKDRTVRELTRFFRPEFLNRIDRIVQFRPLSLEVAEQIARREIDQVLRRSGIRRRGIAVEVSPEVISLLVRDGYSPHFGARPLKRTVERLLLLPLARTISSGQLQGRTILHLLERSGSVQVSVTTGPEKAPAETAIRTIASAASPERRVRALDQAYASLQIRVQPLADRKSELVLKTQSPGFYQDPVVRTATFDELHKLDQFLALHEGLGRALRSLTDHLQHAYPVPAELPALGERIDQLEAELDQLDSIARSKDARDLGDALLTISLVDRVGEPIDAVQKLFHMYEGLARRRRMSVDILGEFWDGQHDRVYLLVSGLGAYVLLRHEAGLHQLDWRRRQRKHRTGKEVTREDREMVRVEVQPVDGEPEKQFTAAVKSKVSILRPARQRLLKADLMLSLFHEPTLRSLELWCCGPRPEALKRCLLVLHATAKCAPPQSENTRVIRNYELGIAPKVKDVRTHRTTTRVDRVFKGYLDHFIFQPETPPCPTASEKC